MTVTSPWFSQWWKKRVIVVVCNCLLLCMHVQGLFGCDGKFKVCCYSFNTDYQVFSTLYRSDKWLQNKKKICWHLAVLQVILLLLWKIKTVKFKFISLWSTMKEVVAASALKYLLCYSFNTHERLFTDAFKNNRCRVLIAMQHMKKKVILVR